MGEALLEAGGLEEFPMPISTPGNDVTPYTTYSHWITKDPDTGVHNAGNYRGQLKTPTRMGVFSTFPQHLAIHWEKCRERGIPLEAAPGTRGNAERYYQPVSTQSLGPWFDKLTTSGQMGIPFVLSLSKAERDGFRVHPPFSDCLPSERRGD